MLRGLTQFNNIFSLVSQMQAPFKTGLHLKNSLSNQLVLVNQLSNNLSPFRVRMLSGTHVGQLYTQIVIWVMQEIISAMMSLEEYFVTTLVIM